MAKLFLDINFFQGCKFLLLQIIFALSYVCSLSTYTNEGKVHAHKLLETNFSNTLIHEAFIHQVSAKSLRHINKNGHYVEFYALSFISSHESKPRSYEIYPAKNHANLLALNFKPD